MSGIESMGRHRDRSIKWVVSGTIVVLGGLTLLLMFLASQMRWAGPSGAVALGSIGVLAVGAFSALALGPVGRAIGRRIVEDGDLGAGALDQEVQDLRLQLDDLRHALTETQERIDFTERLLVRGGTPESDALH
ncbi:MAG: hypothetical protein ACHQXA_02940 [Gemmatimonadales bacterium]